jgi:hypothetical protein
MDKVESLEDLDGFMNILNYDDEKEENIIQLIKSVSLPDLKIPTNILIKIIQFFCKYAEKKEHKEILVLNEIFSLLSNIIAKFEDANSEEDVVRLVLEKGYFLLAELTTYDRIHKKTNLIEDSILFLIWHVGNGLENCKKNAIEAIIILISSDRVSELSLDTTLYIFEILMEILSKEITTEMKALILNLFVQFFSKDLFPLVYENVSQIQSSTSSSSITNMSLIPVLKKYKQLLEDFSSHPTIDVKAGALSAITASIKYFDDIKRIEEGSYLIPRVDMSDRKFDFLFLSFSFLFFLFILHFFFFFLLFPLHFFHCSIFHSGLGG